MFIRGSSRSGAHEAAVVAGWSEQAEQSEQAAAMPVYTRSCARACRMRCMYSRMCMYMHAHVCGHAHVHVCERMCMCVYACAAAAAAASAAASAASNRRGECRE